MCDGGETAAWWGSCRDKQADKNRIEERRNGEMDGVRQITVAAVSTPNIIGVWTSLLWPAPRGEVVSDKSNSAGDHLTR